MDSYHKRKRLLEEKHGKLIHVKPYNDDTGIADNKHQKFVRAIAAHRQLQDITDEEGLRLAYDTKDGLYQHYSILFNSRYKGLSTRPYR